MPANTRVHAIISGRVQGVFYRMETQGAAGRIGVNGWVRNLPDGTVEAVFEGEKDRVTSMLNWCQKGPPNSRVDQVKVDWQDYSGEFSDFKVTY
jgi:acylphosphatase